MPKMISTREMEAGLFKADAAKYRDSHGFILAGLRTKEARNTTPAFSAGADIANSREQGQVAVLMKHSFADQIYIHSHLTSQSSAFKALWGLEG